MAFAAVNPRSFADAYSLFQSGKEISPHEKQNFVHGIPYDRYGSGNKSSCLSKFCL
jgi:hypothetical protein